MEPLKTLEAWALVKHITSNDLIHYIFCISFFIFPWDTLRRYLSDRAFRSTPVPTATSSGCAFLSTLRQWSFSWDTVAGLCWYYFQVTGTDKFWLGENVFNKEDVRTRFISVTPLQRCAVGFGKVWSMQPLRHFYFYLALLGSNL